MNQFKKRLIALEALAAPSYNFTQKESAILIIEELLPDYSKSAAAIEIIRNLPDNWVCKNSPATDEPAALRAWVDEIVTAARGEL